MEEVESKPLSGGCSCGRNRFTVTIPPAAATTEKITVYFDSGHSQRRHHASPLSSWVRVPLSWYHSTTYPVLADETHANIKRVYSPVPNEQRHFCGFCGTPLSYWSELPASESQYISLTLGSLNGSDLRDLEEMGALPKEAIQHAKDDMELVSGLGSKLTESESVPWFEAMVEGSTLSRIKRTGLREEKGGKTIEWEIVEWMEGDDSSLGKRKIDDVEGGNLGQ